MRTVENLVHSDRTGRSAKATELSALGGREIPCPAVRWLLRVAITLSL
jgi:hypothetical protein